MVASLRERLQEYHYYHYSCRSLTLEENIVAVITQDKVIDDIYLKRQIKNRTLCTSRQLLIT